MAERRAPHPLRSQAEPDPAHSPQLRHDGCPPVHAHFMTFGDDADPSHDRRPHAQPDHNIETPDLQRLYAYWEGLRRGREFPARRDIDPLDFRYALGHVMLLDVLHQPLRFRFRLHGTALTLRAGYDMTGKLADELPNAKNRAMLIERCRTVVEQRRPLAMTDNRLLGRSTLWFEVLWLPLAEDGSTISMLMGALYYRDEPAETGLSRGSAA